MKLAPASIASKACSLVKTVPAPIAASGKVLAAKAMHSFAQAVRNVISATLTPPLIIALKVGMVSSTLFKMTTGTNLTCSMIFNASMVWNLLFYRFSSKYDLALLKQMSSTTFPKNFMSFGYSPFSTRPPI